MPPSHLTLHEAERLYERLTELPSVTGAELVSLGSHQQAQIQLSVTDHALLEKARHTVQVDLRNDDDGSATSMIAVDGAVKLEWAAMLRPEVRVVLKEKGEGKRWVEVWKEGVRCHYVDVGGAHGAFATDATFGTSSATVDPSTGRVSMLYQASAKHPKDDEGDGKGSTRDPLDRFQYRAPMGERFAFDFQPRLFLLRLGGGLPANLQEIRASESRPDRLLAQGVLTPNGRHIVATAYDAMAGGRRLGQVYCTNRPSSMWAMPLPKDVTGGGEEGKTAPLSARDKVKAATVIVMEKEGGAQQLSTKGRAARSPRAAPASTRSQVIWLETPEGGAHQQASAILTTVIDDDDKVKIDEIIPLDYKDDLDSNIGLYIDQLPREPFFNSAAQDPPLFGLTTISGSKRIARTFDLAGKKQEAHGLEPGETLSWSFLAGGECGYLALRSGMNSPPEILYAAGDDSPVRTLWKVKLPSSSSDAHLSEAKVRILRIDGTDAASPSDGPIEAILLQPPNASTTTDSPPCILLPHGGPHGTTTTDFAPGTAALCLAGYSILAPNYHGSLGRSPAFVDSLIGKCGTLDIEDCMATLRYAISEGYASAENVYVSGGSHGGFIAGHLAGREPKAWKAVAMRNPVTHIGGQHITSDIPDWCASETGHPYSFNDPPAYPSPEMYANLASVSPLQYHSAIEAPILLLLGDSDQRVPPEQGLALYHALRKRGQSKVAVCWFQGDCHALDTVEGARGSWLAVWRWFEEVGRGRGVE